MLGLMAEASAQTPTVTISSTGGPIQEGGQTLVPISLSNAINRDLYVPIRGRRADGSVYGVTAFVARGKTSGRANIVHNDDDIWQPDGHYDMPVWLGNYWTFTKGGFYNIGSGSGESDTTHSVRVTDNDPLTITFRITQGTINEKTILDTHLRVIFSPDPGRGNAPR